MIPGRTYTPIEWLGIVWKRKWLPVVSCLVVTTAVVVIVKRIPYRYRAEALILAEPRSVAPEYVRSNVTAVTIRERLPTISQQILSRTRLEQVIRKLDLYADLRRDRPIDAVVEHMRIHIQVKVVEGSESFRVTYESENPDQAAQVVDELVGPFIAESLDARASLARETTEFLQSQLTEARRRLVQQEKRLEEYRLRYGPELPTQLQSNIQVIQNLQVQVHNLNEALNRDRDRRLLAARQLADLESEQFLPGPGDAAVAAAQAEPTSTLARLDAALIELRNHELKLTPQHPDLVQARQLVEDLRAKAKKEAEAQPTTRKPTPAENAKRNRIRELKAEVESLDRQVADKLASQEQLRTDLAGYQARVDALPSRESELASLTRDYETLQKVYQGLLEKNEQSKISENLERQQVGAEFRVVDRARRPETPIGPQRRVIVVAGVIAGIGIGLALAVLLHLLDKRLVMPIDVLAALNLPVVATIPFVLGRAERRKAAWRRAGFSAGLTALVVVCVWLSYRG